MIDSIVSHIKVAVRVRPVLPCDYKLSRQKGIKCEICVKPQSDGESVALVKDLYHSKEFHFNSVFGHLESQKNVYEKECKPLVEDFTRGYNACILCYGQSGTGKTYTMFGENAKNWNQEDCVTGMMQQSLRDIFDYISYCRNMNKACKLYVSFYEIYLESVRDLLIPAKVRGQRVNLNIRECPERGTYIEGLSIFEVEDLDSMYDLIHKAVARRVIGDQRLNMTSSRSHAIVRLVLEHEGPKDDDVVDNIILSEKARGKMMKNVFTFCDLAGSERIGKCGSSGLPLKESQNINKSISALGNCIQALSFASNKRDKGGIVAAHIPFRDSKLTRLLADSLSGNTKTLFISTIGPCMHCYTETMSTLTFASRAATVKKLVVKEKASSDVFTDLSRDMFDWQWPAVYKCSNLKAKTVDVSQDGTDWTYDVGDEEAGTSQQSSTKLTVSDFISKSLPDKVSSQSHDDDGVNNENVTIYNDDIAHDKMEEFHEIYEDIGRFNFSSSSHSLIAEQNRHRQPSNHEQMDNSALLFELASGNKDYSDTMHMDFSEENKDFHGNSLMNNQHEDYFGLSTPARAMRKAPPVPPTDDDIQCEATPSKLGLKSALKKSSDISKNCYDSSIIAELDSLSGEIKSLRQNLAEMESAKKETFSSKIERSDSNNSNNDGNGDIARNSVKFDDAMEHKTNEIRMSDLDISGEDIEPRELTIEDDVGGSSSYDGNIYFTVDVEGGSPLRNLEKSIISCGSENECMHKDHTLIDDFSIQDFDDELDKIKRDNGLDDSATSTSRRKKELRFDMRSIPGYDASQIVDVSLNTSIIKPGKVPPPPLTPYCNGSICSECSALKSSIFELQQELKIKNDEISALKEYIHLHNLQIPPVSVMDESSGALF